MFCDYRGRLLLPGETNGWLATRTSKVTQSQATQTSFFAHEINALSLIPIVSAWVASRVRLTVRQDLRCSVDTLIHRCLRSQAPVTHDSGLRRIMYAACCMPAALQLPLPPLPSLFLFSPFPFLAIARFHVSSPHRCITLSLHNHASFFRLLI